MKNSETVGMPCRRASAATLRAGSTPSTRAGMRANTFRTVPSLLAISTTRLLPPRPTSRPASSTSFSACLTTASEVPLK